MMSSEEQVEQAALAFSRARSIADARALIDDWAPRFHEALSESITAGPRPALGMEIATLPGRGGLTARKAGAFFVGIGKIGHYERRFTLAHEFAHVLFNQSLGTRSLALSQEDEEDLCELFARRALAPPTLVRKYLVRFGAPKEIADISLFARHFKISLRASLVVLQECYPDRWPLAFVAATWRGHPKRPNVLGLRIDTSAADKRFFLPPHARLSTLGLRNLEASVAVAEIGAKSSGRDGQVSLRSRQPGVSRWTATNVAWIAEAHRAPGSLREADRRAAICQVDVHQLIATRQLHKPRVRGRRPKRSPARAVPGQMYLADPPLQSGSDSRVREG